MLVAGGDGDAAVDAEVVAGGGEVLAWLVGVSGDDDHDDDEEEEGLHVAEFAEEMGGRGGHCEELTW